MEKIIRWWMTPKFPLIHTGDKTGFIKKWLLHPVKRRIARWYLKILQRFTDIKVIAVTGSAGKTTTKEMLAGILSEAGRTVYTVENIDPIYNIPTTILKTPFGTKYLILEMGVEYPGEMDFYLWLAKPDIGIITNIFPTHTEYLGSIEGVMFEKGKLVASLSEKSIAILNSEDHLLKRFAQKIKAKVIWFRAGRDPTAKNSAAAVACANALNIDETKIKKGLSRYRRPKHRLAVIKLSGGATLLDDSYNSNPEAAISALYVFDKLAKSGRRIAVLGDMLELGEYEEDSHRRVGKEVARLKFDIVIGVGSAAKFIIEEVEKISPKTQSYFVETADKVLPILKPTLGRNTFVLIKGSRSVGLDKVVEELL
jgi:UDP-N-acetylmuramoyl-tripeptide--D-alanyl-D-alanine ligase